MLVDQVGFLRDPKPIGHVQTCTEHPWQLSGKEPTCQCRRHGFNPWVEMMPLRKKWQLTAGVLPGKSHGQKSLAGYSPWSRKQSDTPKRLALSLSLSHLFEISAFSSETRKQSDSGHYYEKRYAVWKNCVNFAVTRLEQVIVSPCL